MIRDGRRAGGCGGAAFACFGRRWLLLHDVDESMPPSATPRIIRPDDASSTSEDVVCFRRDVVRWRVREDWCEHLFGERAPDWLDLERDAGSTLAKSGHNRATFRVTVGSRTVYAKVVDVKGQAGWIIRHTVGDAATREWRLLRDGRVRGVPVVTALALGERRAPPARTVLLSEGEPEAKSLREAWSLCAEQIPESLRRLVTVELIDAAARLFALAHSRGFLHGDAHPDNILVHAGPDRQQRALFVDVLSVRTVRGAAPLSRCLQCLAQLDQYFHRHATRTQRLRFLRRYLIHRGLVSETSDGREVRRAAVASLLVASREHARQLARRRDRRLRRNGTYFATFSLGGGWRATACLHLERRHVFPQHDQTDRSVSNWQTILMSLTEVDDVGSSREASLELHGLTVEQSRLGGLFSRLAATLLGSRHRSEFEEAHRLRHRDVAAELVLAYVEHRRMGLIDKTLLVRPRLSP